MKIVQGGLVLKLIVAVDDDWCIGKDGDLPWPRNKQDMMFFKLTTLGRPVIMGRKTWESIPEKFRPLKDRLNIVLSKNEDYDPGVSDPNRVRVHASLADALSDLDTEPVHEAFVIGGAGLYNHLAVLQSVDEIFLTHFHGAYSGDTYLGQNFVYTLKYEFAPVWTRQAHDSSLSFEKWKRRKDIR